MTTVYSGLTLSTVLVLLSLARTRQRAARQVVVYSSSSLMHPDLRRQAASAVWNSGNSFEFSNGLLYGTSGVVADPEAEVKGTFQVNNFSQLWQLMLRINERFCVSDWHERIHIGFRFDTFTP